MKDKVYPSAVWARHTWPRWRWVWRDFCGFFLQSWRHPDQTLLAGAKCVRLQMKPRAGGAMISKVLSRSRPKQGWAPQYWNYDTFFRETQTQKYCRKLSQFSWIYGWVRLRVINLSRNCLLSKKSIAMWDFTQYRCLLIVEILNIFFARVPCSIQIQCR